MKTRLLQVLWVMFLMCVFTVLGIMLMLGSFHWPIHILAVFMGILWGMVFVTVFAGSILTLGRIADYILYGHNKNSSLLILEVLFCLPLYLERRKNK